MNRIKVGIFIFILLSIPVGLVLINQEQIFKPRASESIVTDRTVRGQIVSFDRNNLVMRVNGAEESFSLENTVDFQYVSSGNYDQSTAVLTPATLNHLSPGFEVLIKVQNVKDVTQVIIIKRGYE